jgi:hypothetical protein
MENYYKRIEIKGEGDLPKKKGTYMICNRQSFYMQTRFNPKLHESKNVWLKEVVWYEVPCDEQIEALEELVEWLDSECPKVVPPLEPYTTADLSHDFAEKLRTRLDELESKLQEVK